MNVQEGQAFLYKHREEIKNAIRTRTYKPSPVKRVEIPKPDGGIRNLGIPTVKDRVIQQAINQVLTTIFENLIIDNRCWRFIKYYKKIFS
jgi:retron-type reverse transcriptase